MKNVKYHVETDRFSLTTEEIDFSLLTACLHVGYRCNLNCAYCFNPFEKDHIEDRGDTALFSALLKLGIQRLVISGGEPFLYQERLLSLLQTAKECHISTLVSTNGTLLTPKIIHTFCPYLNYVDVSVPASTGEGYLRFRGYDGFSLAVNGIKALLEKGIKVRLTYTVSEANYNDVQNLPDLIGALGVKNVRIGYLYDEKGQIATPYPLDDIVKAVEDTGALVYPPIQGKLFTAYHQGYVVLRLDGNAYLSSPKKENLIANILNKDRNELFKIFERIAKKQRILFCE